MTVGGALGDPDAVEPLPEADYFPRIDYLALVCDPEEQARRIRARPGWEDVEEPWADIERQTAADERYRRLGAERDDYRTLDTTDATVAETVAAVRSWIRERV